MGKDKSKESNMATEVFELQAGYTDENGVTHKEVEIREMIGIDEEAIAHGDVRTNIGKIVTTLLSGCVIRIGSLEKEAISAGKWEKIMRDLYLGDRDYILLKIRELTYGNEMSFESRCPNCRKVVNIEFSLDELEIRPLSCDPARIPFELPKGYKDKDGEVCKYGFARMPTGFDQEQLDQVARKNPGTANTMLITRCVHELGKVKLSSKVFRELSLKDREYLVKTLADNNFGPKFLVEAVCDSCGSDFEAGVNPVNFI